MVLNNIPFYLVQVPYGNYLYLWLIALLFLSSACIIVAIICFKRLKDVAAQNLEIDQRNQDITRQFNALINSLNDIIFEFNEEKVCLNVWFNNSVPRVIDLNSCVGKTLAKIIGPEKAKKFDDALDYVMETQQSTSFEYISNFGTGEWFIAKMTPVFDTGGNYTSRISASFTNITAQKKYADALKENEILLTEAQAIAKAGNWWYDYDTNEIYWSENLNSILELGDMPANANKLERYMQLVPPEEQENLSGYFHALQITGDAYHEHKIITPTGNLKYLKISKGGTLNKNGKYNARVFGIIQDITESRLSEKAINLSRTELIKAQTIAKIGNWKWDTGTKTVLWSDEVCHIYGIAEKGSSEYGVLKLLLKYIDKHDKFIFQHFLKSVTKINNYSFIFRVLLPGGKVKYLSLIVGKLTNRDDGSARKITGTLQDITERRKAEIAYKRTENKYKLVLETIKLAALSLDNSGKITFCNYYLASLLGYEQREMVGKIWLDFVPDSYKDLITGWYTTNSIKTQYINPVICRNGEQRIISWQNTVSYDENAQITENTCIGEDITDQQKATEELIYAKELAEKASEFKSDFLSIMSHEIRTPMNAVIGTTNLLLSEDPKPEQLEYLDILKFSAENLLAIINDILDYNKIEAGKLELNISLFNLYELVKKIRKSFYAKALEKLVEVELIIGNNIPEFVTGDQVRLSQILNNLVSNAVKFTQKGTIIIRLDTKSINDASVVIKFSVTDTGIGIAAENLRMIFDPFTQESRHISNNTGGTGLGLAITKRLIELHKSNIHVSSEIGKGTEFVFDITLRLPVAKDKKLPPVLPESPMLNLSGMNILLVDDNIMNLVIATKFLKKWQANVDEALNGQIAVDMVEAKIYDLIIMDLQMPVMDGFEATTIIKSAHPEIPVIALTADAMSETFNKALAAGMIDYLTKPFVPGVFFEKIVRFYKR